jgi:hypothetical protein
MVSIEERQAVILSEAKDLVAQAFQPVLHRLETGATNF